MVYFRRLSQLFFLLLFFHLFWHLGAALQNAPDHHVFMYFSPLFALSGGSNWFWLAALIAFFTLFLGRFFCGWICPLGACIDISDRLTGFFRRGKKRSAFPSQARFLILFAILLALFFGVNLAYFFQPAAILLKAATFLTFPQPIGNFTRWLFPGIFFLILLLGIFQKRFYCQKLCPEGAVFSLLALLSPLRRETVSCSGCGKCLKVCKGRPELDECLRCFSCDSVCPDRAVSFKWKAPQAPREMEVSRRGFMLALGGGLAGVALSKFSPPKKLLRPPGAEPEEQFARFCIRCGECYKACPTGGLQPYMGDFNNLFTPVLVPSIGYCEQRCNLCSQVCPSEAIRHYKVEQKPVLKIGLSKVEPSRCLAYQGRNCLVCVEQCSYQAVKKVYKKGLWVPEVVNEWCVGCGQCEFACPARPQRAITVTPVSSREE